MSEILSQDEINALLSAYGTANGMPTPDLMGSSAKDVRVYDFLSPDRFSKEHLRSLNAIHADFAASLTNTLTGLYQLPTRVNLIGIDQVSYREYRASVPTKTLVSEVSADPLAACMILEVNPSIVGMWVDYLCGGNPQIPAEPSNLTPIDLAVANRVLSSCMHIYSDSWAGMVTFNPEIRRVSNSESFDEPMAPSEAVLVCSFEVNTGEPVGMMTVCIPAVGVEAILPNISSRSVRGLAKSDSASRQKVRKQLEQVNVPCRVVLGDASLSVSEARNLKVGDVIKTTRTTDGQLELLVGGIHLFNCRPGQKGKNLAVMVTDVVQPEVNQIPEPVNQQQPTTIPSPVEELQAAA